MQVRAILQAAAVVQKSGKDVHPEIMIPLVGHVNELKTVQTQLEAVAKKVVEEQNVAIPYMFGTMIEIRAPASWPINWPNWRHSSPSEPTT